MADLNLPGADRQSAWDKEQELRALSLGLESTSDLEKSKIVAGLALKFMARYNITATPENYAVAYNFASGQNAKLVRALEELLARGETLHATLLDELRQKFIDGAAPSEKVREVGVELRGELKDVMVDLENASGNVRDFASVVDGASQVLKKPAPDLQIIIGMLLSSSQDMVTKNEKLKKRLNSSSNKISNLEKRLSSLEKTANIDRLTNIPNRRAFEDKLDEQINLSRSSGKSLSMLLIDIDHFKSVNDTYGHNTGDEVLRLVSKTIAKNKPNSAFAARYGGEEFAVLMMETNPKLVAAAADTIRRTIEANAIIIRGTDIVMQPVTVSIGAGTFSTKEGPIDFVERIDKALYRAKAAGRNRVEFAILK